MSQELPHDLKRKACAAEASCGLGSPTNFLFVEQASAKVCVRQHLCPTCLWSAKCKFFTHVAPKQDIGRIV